MPPSNEVEAWERLRAAIERRFSYPGPEADREVAELRDELVRAMGDDPDRTNIVQLTPRRRRRLIRCPAERAPHAGNVYAGRSFLEWTPAADAAQHHRNRCAVGGMLGGLGSDRSGYPRDLLRSGASTAAHGAKRAPR